MDVSPIQRMAMNANHAIQRLDPVREAPAVTPAAQAQPAAADQSATHRNDNPEQSTRVVVAWHPASLGYVTKVVEQHSGSVLYQSPPEQILEMVQDLIAKLEQGAA